MVFVSVLLLEYIHFLFIGSAKFVAQKQNFKTLHINSRVGGYEWIMRYKSVVSKAIEDLWHIHTYQQLSRSSTESFNVTGA